MTRAERSEIHLIERAFLTARRKGCERNIVADGSYRKGRESKETLFVEDEGFTGREPQLELDSIVKQHTVQRCCGS